MFAHFAKKAQVIKCFCGGTKSARIWLRGTKSASGYGPWGTKSVGGPNPLLHRIQCQKSLNLLKHPFARISTWLTYKRTLCHEVERQRRLYGNTVSLASLKKYICVKTRFSTTAAMVATGAIIWKPGLRINSFETMRQIKNYNVLRRPYYVSLTVLYYSCVNIKTGEQVITWFVGARR